MKTDKGCPNCGNEHPVRMKFRPSSGWICNGCGLDTYRPHALNEKSRDYLDRIYTAAPEARHF